MSFVVSVDGAGDQLPYWPVSEVFDAATLDEFLVLDWR